jgi:hypothetical protein
MFIYYIGKETNIMSIDWVKLMEFSATLAENNVEYAVFAGIAVGAFVGIAILSIKYGFFNTFIK